MTTNNPSADDRLSRSRFIFGDEGMARLSGTRVIVFGVGGVGSWCAESLVRTGIGHLTMVDFDTVCPSNINRQLHATTSTIGQIKVEAMRSRLLDINPEADIQTVCGRYDEATADGFALDQYDYIVDAIDSLPGKILLMQRAPEGRLFASMGAARKTDPTRIRTADFWSVSGCPLAARLRKMIRKQGLPKRHFTCVFSDEALPPEISSHHDGSGRANGSLVHITAIFGMTIAGLILKEIYGKTSEK